MKTFKTCLWTAIVAMMILVLGLQIAPAQERQRREPQAGEQGGGDFKKMLEDMDKDADGKISSKEFKGLESVFTKMDENKDGFLTEDEAKKAQIPEDNARGDRSDRRRGDDQGGRRGQFDPARMQEMMMERIKTTLESTDEEWKVIQPLVKNVNDIQMKMRFGGFRRGRGGPGGPPSDENPEVTALRTVLESQKPAPEEIKTKLTAYRDAQKKNEEGLQKARADLRKVLTLKQEANLVLMGLLD